MPKREAASAPTPRPPAVTVGRLHSIEGIRRECARLYRAGRLGEIDAADASRLASLLALMARLVEAGDLERRVAALEQSEKKT